MSAIINRATLREELQNQNRALESAKASIQPLRTAIGSYVSDSELQGSGFSAHKNYLTEGHIPTLDELTRGIDALMNANSSNMAAIDTHLQSDSYDQQQIENELSSLNRQINSWWFPLYESINRQGARTLRNRRTNVQSKHTRLQNYLSATNHLYDGMEDIWMAAERNLVRIENKTVCPQTGEFILLPAEMVDEIILESLLSGELGLSNAELLDSLRALGLAGTPLYTAFGGDPINMSTGNFIYSKSDISIPGRYPLEFKRFYNSIGGTDGVLGANWTHSYNIRLISVTEKSAQVIFGDGHMESYSLNDDGSYTSPPESDNKLVRKESRWELTTKSNETYRFSITDGSLKSITDLNSKDSVIGLFAEKTTATEFEHSDGLLSKVKNPCGSLSLKYDRNNRLIKVTDHTGREAKYEYSGNLLSKATHPNTAEHSYEYDENGNLTKVTNPLGITSIYNELDKHGRAIRQSFADGGVYSLDYDDKLTTATEQNGNVIKYEHDDKYRTVRTIYSDSEERFEYNEQNKRTKHIDRNGNVRKFEYDESGNLTKATDPLGNETTIEYNEHNKPIQIATPNGGMISNEYDTKGNVTTTVNPLGHAVKLTNNKEGLVTEIILPDGSKSGISYDGSGNILSVTDTDGNETKYEYDSLNRVVKTTDPNGNETHFEYNAKGDITKVTNAEGKAQTYEYNTNGKLIRLTDFNNGATEYKYNSMDKLKEVINSSCGVTKLEYDLMWNVTSITDPCGNTVHYEYDNNQRVIKTIDEEGNATSYGYDANGNVTTFTSAIGVRTEIAYDALNRQIKITEPDGAVTRLEYDALSNIIKMIDPQGGKIIREYNKAGQLMSITDQLNDATTYTYTSLGQLGTITDAMGRTTKHSYYPGGRIKTLTRPGGESENYEYDKNGNITRITDSIGNITLIAYDCLDRIVKTTNPLGFSKHFAYDSMGNITCIIDENGNATQYIYSPTGNIIEVIDAMGHSTKYSYDKAGKMTRMEQYRVIDETYADIRQIEMQVTTWLRNHRGDVIRKSTPIGGESLYEYDSIGNLVSKVDEDGLKTLYEYNLANKLTKVAYADGKIVELSYSPLRRLTQLRDWLGTTKIELDAVGRATKVTDHDENVVEYTWDSIGRRESITYPDSGKVSYSYNLSGRLERITSEAGTTKYSYDAVGRLKERTMPGDIVTQYGIDALGRLESLTHKKSDEILDSLKYSYDPRGNITQIKKYRTGIDADNGTFSYSYDPIGRLIKATTGQKSKEYQYDSIGNRIMSLQNGIETQHRHNARNQLIQTTEGDIVKDYRYDNRGNLTSILENGVAMSNFTFSAANRMIEAVTYKGKAEYEYNGFLKRISTREALYNEETSTFDPLTDVRYTTDMTKPYNDLLMIGEQRFIWSDELLFSEGCNEFAYLSDHLGSPIRLLGDKQDEALAYDEFGVPTVEVSGCMHNPFGFTGYQPDYISGLCYALARYYDPQSSRFNAEDGAKDGLNWYIYCSGNPLGFIDPTGMAECERVELNNEWRNAQEVIRAFMFEYRRNSFIIDWFTRNTQSGVLDGFLSMFGFERSEYGILHARQITWQMFFGFNNLYEYAFGLATNKDHRRYTFSTPDEDFVLWMWRGDYINFGAGAEMGLYSGGPNHWATGIMGGHMLPMSIVVYENGERFIDYAPPEPHWWITGFDPSRQGVSDQDICVRFEVDFSSRPDLWEAFANLYDGRSNWTFYDDMRASYEWESQGGAFR